MLSAGIAASYSSNVRNIPCCLQALHHRGLAHGEHTRLLLNCYTKLQDTARLDEFITWENELYDVDSAIHTLRQV
jgi:hypothetical protein